ncbi:hypothetical protein [Gordonia sp. ABSL11-1]|uniref:alpha/beta fold hydrolase n=1 Tax=Gordonia sp. ABSL11-1 TaxID=3053924 RepID=UPI00336538E4
MSHRRPGRLVDVDGITLHVLDEGDGPPLLMLAALGSNWFDLDPLTDRLRASWRIIRYGRPGYGLSEPIAPLNHPTLDGEVEWMRGVQDAVGPAGRSRSSRTRWPRSTPRRSPGAARNGPRVW